MNVVAAGSNVTGSNLGPGYLTTINGTLSGNSIVGSFTSTVVISPASGGQGPSQFTLVSATPQFEIVVVQPNPVPPSVGLPGSIVACGVLPSSHTSSNISAMFVDATGTQITGGNLVLSLSEEVGSGGHPHSGRPLGTLDPSSGPSPLTSIYIPGEASGDIDIKVTGIAPDGSTPAPAYATIQIGTQGFVSLTGVAFVVSNMTHPSGTFGTVGMQSAVGDMGNEYPTLAAARGDLNPTSLRSEAASLPFGGIFDIDRTWAPPHCGHRDGNSIDLSLSSTTARERLWMDIAAHDAGLGFYYIPESPASSTANHWHATLR